MGGDQADSSGIGTGLVTRDSADDSPDTLLIPENDSSTEATGRHEFVFQIDYLYPQQMGSESPDPVIFRVWEHP